MVGVLIQYRQLCLKYIHNVREEILHSEAASTRADCMYRRVQYEKIFSKEAKRVLYASSQSNNPVDLENGF